MTPGHPLTNIFTMASAAGLRVHEWGQLHVSLQWVYRGKVPEGGRGDFSGICGGAAWYILRGEAWLRHRGAETRARAGEWLFPLVEPHYRSFSRDAEIISLRFYMEWPDGQPLFTMRESKVIRGSSHPELLRTARTLERAVYKSAGRNLTNIDFMHKRIDFSSYAGVAAALLQWSRAMYDALTAEGIKPNVERFEDERVVRALQVLDGWPLHQAFSLGQLLQITGISRAQLDRLFTLKLGLTARQYFERRRLRHAERSVQRAEHSIKEVAFDVGFRHVSSFSAWFKQNTGVNPNVRREASAPQHEHNEDRRGNSGGFD